jgi:hypothetical protein
LACGSIFANAAAASRAKFLSGSWSANRKARAAGMAAVPIFPKAKAARVTDGFNRNRVLCFLAKFWNSLRSAPSNPAMRILWLFNNGR